MALLKLLQIEFLKLRRRTFVWMMMFSALIMPFLAYLLFKYAWDTGGDPVQFYKWSAFGFTLFIILPVVLGILSTMLMYNENQYDMLKQLWIVPVSKMSYFFSKFLVVLIYSVCFMIVTAIGSVIFSILLGDIAFDWQHVLFLIRKCLEIGVITAFAMLPILAIAAAAKRIYSSSCCNTSLCFSWFNYRVNQYVYTPVIQHGSNRCSKWRYSRTEQYAGSQHTYGDF